MAELQAAPCDSDKHRTVANCDCTVCGWHVRDVATTKDASGAVVIDGRVCVNGRPRADEFSD
jgi:hypothetical protein